LKAASFTPRLKDLLATTPSRQDPLEVAADRRVIEFWAARKDVHRRIAEEDEDEKEDDSDRAEGESAS